MDKKNKIGNDERRVKRYAVSTYPKLEVRELTFLKRQLEGGVDSDAFDGELALFKTKAQAERFKDFAQPLITACTGDIESISIVLADERLSKEFEAGIVSVCDERKKKKKPSAPKKQPAKRKKKTATKKQPPKQKQ